MHPTESDMSSVAFIENARTWSMALEAREQKRSGLSLVDARRVVARRADVSPGTLENLRKRRLKSSDVGWYTRLRLLLIEELKQEMRAHAHEIETLMALGADASSDALEEAQASLKAIQEALDHTN